MKRGVSVLMAVVLVLLLSVSVLAADTASGVCVISIPNASTSLEGYTESGKANTTTVTVDNQNVKLFENAVKLQVTYKGAQNGKFYLVLALSGEESAVPTKDNIVYIDQITATGSTISFDVYPSELEADKSYTIKLVSDDGLVTSLTTLATYKKVENAEVVPYKLGDVNEDGKIDTSDAVLILRHVAKLNILDGNHFLAADVSGDGKVDTSDAVLVLRYVAKLITSF